VTERFVTDDGVAVPAITTEQMREVDRVAVEELGPNLFQMMENAGRNLALTAFEMLGAEWRSAPIVVLAGAGGNGGGGICAARHMANHGADVTVVVTRPEGLSPVTADQLDVYRATAGRSESLSRIERLKPALVVDALIGYGLAGRPRGASLAMLDWAKAQTSPILALDVPSGVDTATGAAPGAHIRAGITMTLGLPKTGLGVAATGHLHLADVGIPAAVYRRVGIDVPPDLFGERYRVGLRPLPTDRAGPGAPGTP
jgi:NAD(P)H-hydrate epimerase